MNLSRRAALLSAGSGLLAPRMALAQTTEVATREALDRSLPALDNFVLEALKRTGVPGLSVAIVLKDQVVYLKGFGVRQVGKSESVDPDTVFQLASMSKPIASTVVAALV